MNESDQKAAEDYYFAPTPIVVTPQMSQDALEEQMRAAALFKFFKEDQVNG